MGRQRGLTLIELAIVLIVLGILLGMGAGIVGVLIKRVKYNESKEIVNANVEAVIGYANAHGKLPANAAEIQEALKNFRDSYGKRMMYVFDAGLGNPDSICNSTGTNITLRVRCANSSCTSYEQEVQNVAFLIISGNGNHNIQTVESSLVGSGITQVLGANPDDPVIALSVDSGVTLKTYRDDVSPPPNVDDWANDIAPRPEPYDDIVQWVTLYELQKILKCSSVSITSPSDLPLAEEDSPYNYQLQAQGGVHNKWGVVSGSGSSCDISSATRTFGTGNWLTLDRDTGILSGIANEDTSSPPGVLNGCTSPVNLNNVCVCADINNNNICDTSEAYDSANFTIEVRAKSTQITTSPPLPSAWEGTDYSTLGVSINATGGDGNYTFSISDAPSWLSIDPSSGQLTGTPPTDAGCSETLVNFTVSASSCSMTDAKGFSITVRDPDCYSTGGGGGGGCPTLTLSPAGGTYSATVGNPFSLNIALSGGQPPINILSCAPSTCNGLSFSCSTVGATILGTPISPGSCTFSVTYQDSCSPTPQTVTGNYTVNITGCPSLSGIAGSLPDATNCISYSGTITAIGGQTPYAWSYTGTLPNGINFCTTSSSSCTLSGTPSAPKGSYNFSVQVTDGCGQGPVSQNFTIRVIDNCNDIRIRNKLRVGAYRVTLYYKKNGGGCTKWKYNGDIKIKPTDTIDIYWDATCTWRSVCRVDYCQMKGYDWDSDCKVQIYDTNSLVDCEFTDR